MSVDLTSGREIPDEPEPPEDPEFAPLCIWCSAPWSDKNVKLEIEGAYSYDSDSDPGYPVVTISCHVCKREMYRKEGGF